MANREALRELQTRLASRLQAAKAEGSNVSSWLAVETAGQRYLLPLGHSGEIFPWAGVQAVPYTQPWFLGVANLRGALMAVVDLGGMLGAQVSRTEQTLADSSLLALNPALSVNAALMVDKLLGLRGTDAFVASDAPAEGAQDYFGSRYTDAQGVQWQELNLQAMSQSPVFLGIGV
ncbi:hypothetical protein SDC9_75188 [bioreactor metagenome]|uniref:CheW-like domain-containing protein n=1 Tax=bioreactor metagenome TaxID=1076179 RepID=A0A644YLA1_9ZZZZ